MKIDRLISIIMILNNRGRVSANELANIFEVSQRTIQRDIDAINMAGIPIVAFKGQDGGYEILENYKINNSFMTYNDASMVITLLNGLKNVVQDNSINGLVEKFKAVNGNNKISEDNFPFIIDFSYWGDTTRLKQKISKIKSAINEGTVISFSYINANSEFSDREIEPIAIILKSNAWYVYGYCLKREDFRIFKISRIKDLELTSMKYTKKEIRQEDIFKESNRDVIDLKLRFNKRAMNRIEDYFEVENLIVDEEGKIEVNVQYPYDSWVKSMILSFGADVEVLEPAWVKDKIKEEANKIINLYMT